MLKRICQSCNTEFIATNNNQKFCTKSCRNIKISCIQCGTEFVKYYKKTTKFCSDNCYHTHQHVNKKEYEQHSIECKFCKNTFTSIKSNQEYCSRLCMYEARKVKHSEVRVCPHCKTEFTCYKKSKKECCSIKCSLHYKSNQESRIKGFDVVKSKYDVDNIMDLPEYRDKIAKTKLARFGNAKYNNIEKNRATCLERHGVPYGVLKAKSNGIGISKPQRKLYELIKEKYPDAILEYQIPELNISADIYIPEKNLIVEFFGDYWHCNPNKYDASYQHKFIHQSASEIWERDETRKQKIKDLGFNVLIIWESEFNSKTFTFPGA